MNQYGQLILCADGERSTLDLLDIYLTASEFSVVTVESAREIFAAMTVKTPSLIVLGLEVPDMGGFDVLRQIKNNTAASHIPIVVMSEKQEDIVKILALELGADDYMEKPFSGRELVARVRAILRNVSEPDLPVVMTNGPLSIDIDKQEAYLDGVKLPLEMSEFMILRELLINMGQTLTIYQLGGRVWGYNYLDSDTAARIHTKRLKGKLGEYGYLMEVIRSDAFRMVVYPAEE